MKILVVGQGIAGSVLTHTLSKYPCEISVIDNGHKTASSIAASGIFSPMVLKRLVKSWEIDTILPFAIDFYRKLERNLNIPLVEICTNYRKIAQESELEDWRKKSNDIDLQDYLNGVVEKANVTDKISAAFGYGVVENSGKVNIHALLQGTVQFLKDRLRTEEFDYDQLKLTDKVVFYKNEPFNKIIFCEGYKAVENPFFPCLKMKPVKGENLTLSVPGLDLKKIIKSNIYILPAGDNIYHIGSTYNWEDLNEKTTKDARNQLLEKFEKLISLPYTVLNQKAGVRPSSNDRRPILGESSLNQNLQIFNGLGAKGLLLSPFFADHFCQYLFHGETLKNEVNISRFRKAKN